MTKQGSILKINKELAKTFDGDPIISFKKARNLQELFGGNTIIENKFKRTTKENMSGKCPYAM